jgi:hypothetical protein
MEVRADRPGREHVRERVRRLQIEIRAERWRLRMRAPKDVDLFDDVRPCGRSMRADDQDPRGGLDLVADRRRYCGIELEVLDVRADAESPAPIVRMNMRLQGALERENDIERGAVDHAARFRADVTDEEIEAVHDCAEFRTSYSRRFAGNAGCQCSGRADLRSHSVLTHGCFTSGRTPFAPCRFAGARRALALSSTSMASRGTSDDVKQLTHGLVRGLAYLHQNDSWRSVTSACRSTTHPWVRRATTPTSS